MKLGDFASVLQLGVGLHVGSALLQTVAEFASSPISKRIERLAKLATLRRTRLEAIGSSETAAATALEDDTLDTLSTLELKKVQFFNEYRIAAIVNTCAAAALFALLVLAAVEADFCIHGFAAALIVISSFAPAVLSLAILWVRWDVNTKDIHAGIKSIERRLLG
jgi:hypothetical protein